jgi:general secretion pathway protein E
VTSPSAPRTSSSWSNWGKQQSPLDANDQHIVTIVDWLWQYAFEQRASDIHIEPRRDFGVVRFRIDGVLHQVYQIPMPVLGAMTSRIKILGRMDVVEKRRPQDGRIKTRAQDGQEVELRLSTLPTAFGEKLVMRVFDPEVLVRDFSELGFADEDRAALEEMTAQPNGIILVTGPTGSGQDRDPVLDAEEPRHAGGQRLHAGGPDRNDRGSFNQVQIRPTSAWASPSRHPLADAAGPGHHHGRRNPRPGNGRDGDPGGADRPPRAVHAAYQRRAVGDHAPARSRRAAYLLSATVLGVMAQRLMRTLCPKCKQPGGLRAEDEAAWTALVAPWKSTMPTQLYHPGRLPRLPHDRLQGAVGIYEIMRMSPEIMKLVRNGARTGEAARAGHARRHEAAAHRRREEGGGGTDHHRGNHQGRAADVRRQLRPHVRLRINRGFSA